jgi:integrase/recombinase XerD
MKKFKAYLKNRGISLLTANEYARVVTKYLNWLRLHDHSVMKVKRSLFTNYLEQCRQQGNKEVTARAKETAIRHYYTCIGAKNNPAVNWIDPKKKSTLPPSTVSKDELVGMYEGIKPKSTADHRNRCMLGLVLFQGLLRSELQELRVSDIDLEKGSVFIQGQHRTNSRRLKLDPMQLMHLYAYLNKYRVEYLRFQSADTDYFFLSKGTGIKNSIERMIIQFRKTYPQVEDLRHIRSSVISHWDKVDGIIEAMTRAGHRYVTSTQRYQTGKYDELQDLLRLKHPLESHDVSGFG